MREPNQKSLDERIDEHLANADNPDVSNEEFEEERQRLLEEVEKRNEELGHNN